MARMSRRFQIMNQYASKGTLVSVAIWCAAILLVAPPTHARRFLERTADTIIPAPPGSLGDVVPDSVISVLDLVRLRDIANGIAPAPSPTELTQGDLNLDGVVDNADVDIVARVLLKAQGVPQVVDATSGGTVVSNNVAMTFAPRDIGGSLAVGVMQQSDAQVSAQAGVDFQTMEADSSYFMTGWKLGYTDSSFVYPPQMAVALDSMPPCELQGSNLLMAARRGPLGDPQSVIIANLTVRPDSTLEVADPPYPTIGQPSRIVGSTTVRTDSYEPCQYMLLPVNNISMSKLGDIVLFSRDNINWIPVSASWFIPLDWATVEDITAIAVAVPDLAPGTTAVKFLNLGTGLTSNEVTIDILPLHVPAVDPILPIELAFGAMNSMLVAYPEFSFQNLEPYSLFEEANQSIPQELCPLYQSMQDSLVNSSLGVQLHNIARLENLNVLARIDEACDLTESYPDSMVTRRAVLRSMEAIFDFGIACYHSVINEVIISGNRDSEQGDQPLYRCGKGGPPNDVDKGLDPLYKRDTSGLIIQDHLYAYGLNMAGSSFSSTNKASGTGFQPIPYPNYCLNIWRHNTNAGGNVGNGGGCPSPAKHADSRRLVVGGKSINLDLSYYISPLAGAVVMPVSGGIPGIVGIVNDAGTFAIPGLTPGADIHFAVYDPNTGLYDPDAGHAVTPNIAEHGVWFPVTLSFRPDRTVVTRSYEFREQAQDTIDSVQQRVEYVLQRTAGDPGSISLGFCATAPMRLQITAPDGQVLVDFDNDEAYLSTAFAFDQEGPYKIRVGYGTAPVTGSFVLGTGNYGSYPLQRIGCSPEGRLPDDLTPFEVFGSAVVPAGRTLTARGGQIIEFTAGSSLRANGDLQAVAQPNNPLVLRPAAQ